jgi:protein gp37
MADKTKIEWTDATWNPVTGCSLVSKGCRYCYAAALAASRLKNHPSRKGLAKRNAAGVAQFTGEVRFNEKWIDQPLRWRKPRRIFVCAHADLFHENVPDEWIDKVFAVMALCPQHTFQVLTKRPERMLAYLTTDRREYLIAAAQAVVPGPTPGIWPHLPLPNVWLGVSIEDQPTADTRIPYLLKTPAAVRFVSAEPLLGPVDLRSLEGGTLWIGGNRGCGGKHHHIGRHGDVIHGVKHDCDPRFPHHHHDELCGPGLDWVIVGGESGDHARAMDPQWARALRDQCSAAGVPFLFKQWGVWLPRSHAAHLGNEINDQLFGEFHEPDGEWIDCCLCSEGAADMPMFRVGKAAAGRVLDGVTHDGFPEVRA